jgi:hypothetical protein
MAKLTTKYFSASGSWVCPAGVTNVYLIGQGGGCSGQGGPNSNNQQANGGAGTTPYLVSVVVVPNTSYTVTIGAGGIGPVGNSTGGAAVAAVAGGHTTFGALWTFKGAATFNSWVGHTGSIASLDNGHVMLVCGYAGEGKVTSGYVVQNTVLASSPSSWNGGTNGSPGYSGSVGGAGGAGSATGNGTNGSAGTGIGAGGGCGGSGFTGFTGGTGGNGGNGQMWVLWVE